MSSDRLTRFELFLFDSRVLAKMTHEAAYLEQVTAE